MNRQKFKVGRSKEGTLFELSFIVIAILVWVGIIMMFNHAPDTVPTHFGPSGTPDAYGSKYKMLFPCILMTVVGACFLAGAYFPHTVNLPGVEMTNARQAMLGVRMMRIMALLFVALTAAIAADTMRGHILFVFFVLAALLIVSVVFTILIYRAKNE